MFNFPKKKFNFDKQNLSLKFIIFYFLIIFTLIFLTNFGVAKADDGSINITLTDTNVQVGQQIWWYYTNASSCSDCHSPIFKWIKLNWGDGTEDFYSVAPENGVTPHAYSSPGIYKVQAFYGFNCGYRKWGFCSQNAFYEPKSNEVWVTVKQPLVRTVSLSATARCSNNKPVIDLNWWGSPAGAFFLSRYQWPWKDYTKWFPGTRWIYPDVENIRENNLYYYQIKSVLGTNEVMADAWVTTPSCNQNPFGYHDGIIKDTDNICKTWGWARDPNTANPIAVHLYLDGPAGGGGTFISSVLANQPGGDLPNQNHLFSYSLMGKVPYNGKHKIYAYAINYPLGSNPLLTNTPKEFDFSVCKTTATFNVLMVANQIIINRSDIIINYDSNAVNNPPPGFKELLTPIWQETNP